MRPNFASIMCFCVGPRHQERAAQVDVHDGVPVVGAHLEEHVVADDAGVVDEHRRGAELGGDALDGGLHLPASSETSTPTARPLPPAVSIVGRPLRRRRTRRGRGRRRRYPSAARRLATAAPMPRAAPVTMAVRWVSCRWWSAGRSCGLLVEVVAVWSGGRASAGAGSCRRARRRGGRRAARSSRAPRGAAGRRSCRRRAPATRRRRPRRR